MASPRLSAGGDAVRDVDDGYEVRHQVEPVKDFAIRADSVPSVVHRQVVQPVGVREVVQVPFRVGEEARPRGGPVGCPWVRAADHARVSVPRVTRHQNRITAVGVQVPRAGLPSSAAPCRLAGPIGPSS